jgi:hypothetical protein
VTKKATSGSWQPGQSGNPAGTAKNKLFRQAIVMELKSKGNDKDAMPELRDIARALINTAKDAGHQHSLAATKEIADRLDGKSPVMVTDADEFRKATELTDDELTARIEDARRLLGLADQAANQKELH